MIDRDILESILTSDSVTDSINNNLDNVFRIIPEAKVYGWFST